VLEELATWTVEDTDALLDYAMKYAPSETRGEPSQELFRAMRVAAAVEVCDWPFLAGDMLSSALSVLLFSG
jgi:hypothetical protein